MAHHINYNEQTEKHSFFSVKQKAWHNLGQIIQDYPTSAEAIGHAGLDYEVEKRKLFTPCLQEISLDGETIQNQIEVPNYFSTVRTDNNTVLGVVGKEYQIVQNRDAFSFFDSIVGGDGILYETAGALGKGERIFITAKLPDYIRVGNDDLIEKYVFLTTSHDGSGSITAAFTPIRIVCANTLNAAMHNKTNTVRIRHTSNAKQRLEQAHKVMGISDMLSAQMETIFNDWTKVRITDSEVKKLIQSALVPNKEVLKSIQEGREEELSTCFNNMVDSAFEYAMSDPTQLMETTKGTVFGAYNAHDGYAIWCTPSQRVDLFFVEGLAIPNGKASVPPLLWKASKNNLRIYAMDSNKEINEQTALFHAPFFNLYEDGRVCMGTVSVNITEDCLLEEFMEKWEQYFFNSYFSHLIHRQSPVKGNVIQLWKSLVNSRKQFPIKYLIKNDLTIKNLLP